MTTIQKILKKSIWLACIALLIPGAAAQARYGGFWRNAFESKSSWLELNTESHYYHGVEHLAMSQLAMGLCALSPAAVPLVMLHNDRMDNEISEIISAAGISNLTPPAPIITRVQRVEEGLLVYFRCIGISSTRERSFNLYHFTVGDAAPRTVYTFAYNGWGPVPEELPILDPNPPDTGATFYAMTTTVNGNGSSASLEQWWGSVLESGSDRSHFLEYMFRRHVGWTSDYSAPYVYNAFPGPVTGGIEAIAVHPDSGDVFASQPGETAIHKIINNGETLSEPALFVDTGFATPGQKGLAIDARGNLFTNNAASNALYGGRLFKFTSTGSRGFSGTLNYFSQMLMFANPAACGPMTMGYDNQLYAYEAISREVKQIPVNAAYDPYRRVGHMYYGYGGTDTGNVIDLDCGAGMLFGAGFLYILDSNSIKGLPLGLASGVRGTAFDRIPLD